MDDSEPNVCRICQEEDDKKLIAPCRCNGTVKYIHEECFNKWIQTSKNNTTCPTCGGPYNEEFIIEIKHSVDFYEKFSDFMDIFCKELGRSLIQLTMIFAMTVLLEVKITFIQLAYIILPVFFIGKIIFYYGSYRNRRL